MLTQAEQAIGPHSQLVVSGAMAILHVLKCVPLRSNTIEMRDERQL
jgi:hypothetical protein